MIEMNLFHLFIEITAVLIAVYAASARSFRRLTDKVENLQERMARLESRVEANGDRMKHVEIQLDSIGQCPYIHKTRPEPLD